MSNQYLVQSGDTLGEIAHRHDLTLGELLQANPQFTTNGRNPNLIYPGETVHVAIESRFSKMLNVANAILLCSDPDLVDADDMPTYTYSGVTRKLRIMLTNISFEVAYWLEIGERFFSGITNDGVIEHTISTNDAKVTLTVEIGTDRVVYELSEY